MPLFRGALRVIVPRINDLTVSIKSSLISTRPSLIVDFHNRQMSILDRVFIQNAVLIPHYNYGMDAMLEELGVTF